MVAEKEASRVKRWRCLAGKSQSRLARAIRGAVRSRDHAAIAAPRRAPTLFSSESRCETRSDNMRGVARDITTHQSALSQRNNPACRKLCDLIHAIAVLSQNGLRVLAKPGEVASILPSTNGGAPITCGIGIVFGTCGWFSHAIAPTLRNVRLFKETGVAVQLLMHDAFGGKPSDQCANGRDASSGRSTALISSLWS